MRYDKASDALKLPLVLGCESCTLVVPVDEALRIIQEGGGGSIERHRLHGLTCGRLAWLMALFSALWVAAVLMCCWLYVASGGVRLPVLAWVALLATVLCNGFFGSFLSAACRDYRYAKTMEKRDSALASSEEAL